MGSGGAMQDGACSPPYPISVSISERLGKGLRIDVQH
jgi:hypothetical protein